MTTPIEPGSGRCGECAVFRGRSQVSPSLMCTVCGKPSTMTLTCIVPLIW